MRCLVPASSLTLVVLAALPLACGGDDQREDTDGHEMSSANPFGVTVWGWGSNASVGFNSVYVSYAYPAGAAIKSINDVVVLPQ